MACTAEIVVSNPNLEGGKGTITLPLPSINSLDELPADSLREIADLLMQDQNTLSLVKDWVNSSKFPKNRWEITAFGENALPIGNTTLTEVKNKYSGNSDISIYLDGIERLGVATDINDILLLDTEFSIDYFKHGGIYTRNGKDIAIIKDSENNVKAYLGYVYTSNWVKQNDKSWQTAKIKEKMDSILSELSSTASERSRLKKILPLIKDLDTFIKYFQLSAYFRGEAFKTKNGMDLNNLLNGIIDPESMKEIPYYDNSYVREFIANIKEGKMSRSDFEAFKDKYNFDSLEDVLHFLNGKDANLELVFEGRDIIQFKELLAKKSSRDSMVDYTVSSDYFSNLTNKVFSQGEYSVVSVGDADGNFTYYVTDKYTASEEDLVNESKPFKKFADAKSSLIAKAKLDKLDFSGYKIALKESPNLSFTDSTLKIGDKFQSLDVQIAPNTKLSGYDKGLFRLLELKKGTRQATNVQEFLELLKKDAKYKKMGLDFSVLNTKEKIETFFLLKENLRDQDLEKTFKSPNQLTPERIAYESKIAQEALNTIITAKTNLYEVTSITGDKVKVIKLNDRPTNFSNNTSFEDNSVRAKIYDVADRLVNQFGIKINLVSSKDLVDFPGVDGSENGFIYNGEVYINMDNASPKDVLHEYGHLVMGTIKQRNPQLYSELTSSMENLEDFNDKVTKYKELYPNRALRDIEEEIFVDLFGEYNIDKEALPEVKDEIKKIFGLTSSLDGESIETLNQMTLNDLMLNFGSVVLSSENNIVDANLSSNSRVISNLVEKLMKLGMLKENCNG